LSLAGCPSALPRTFVTFVTPAVPTGARQRRSPIILSSSIVVVGIIIIISTSTTNTITSSSSSSMRTVCAGTRLLRARTDRRRVDSCRRAALVRVRARPLLAFVCPSNGIWNTAVHV
jgi:hypothetical protein